MQSRTTKIIVENKQEMKMDAQLYKVFKGSNSVSTQKGISGQLMKTSSKRRRGKQEIKD